MLLLRAQEAKKWSEFVYWLQGAI